MPENIGATGAPYITKIPRQDENADIQTALRLYHYGEDTNNPDEISPESLAGHLNDLEQSKVNLQAADLLSSNLDTIVTTGFYSQQNAANAVGNNYPEDYAGLLTVVNDNGVVSQVYHVIGEVGNIINKAYWRVRFSGSWSNWNAFVTPSEVTEITGQLYHTKSVTWTRSEADAKYAPKFFTENSKIANHTLELADINKVVNMSVAGGGTLTVPNSSTTSFDHGSVVNVYNSSDNVLSIVAATGVVVRNIGTLEPFKEASLRYRGNNEWVAAGPLY